MSDIIDVFTTAGTNKGLYYGGAFRAAQTDAVINVTNPATAAHFTTVPDGSSEDVDAAVAAAQSAFGIGPPSTPLIVHATYVVLRM